MHICCLIPQIYDYVVAVVGREGKIVCRRLILESFFQHEWIISTCIPSAPVEQLFNCSKLLLLEIYAELKAKGESTLHLL